VTSSSASQEIFNNPVVVTATDTKPSILNVDIKLEPVEQTPLQQSSPVEQPKPVVKSTIGYLIL